MPIVTFQPFGIKREVEVGTTLYTAAIEAGLPVASSCHADGVCGKCVMTPLAGEENVSDRTELEERLIKKERSPETDRISCQTVVFGDCTFTTRYW